MASRGQSIVVSFIVWDTAASTGKTGDNGNLTLRVVKDGTSSAPSNASSEVDSTNCPGVYKITLTGTECTADCVTLCGKSSTADVVVIPITITFEQLPTAAPGASNGLPQIGVSPLTNLDTAISTVAAYIDTEITTIINRIGVPAGASLSADVATVATYIDTEIGTILTRLGSPAGASMSADIATLATYVDTEVATLVSRLGTPAGASIAADIATVNTNVTTVAGYVDTEVATLVSRLGTPVGASISADIAAVKSETASILDDTGTSGVVVASASKTGYSISGTKTTLDALQDLSAAQVNAQVLDVLSVDTFSQPGQESPAATQTFVNMLAYLYKAWRNKHTQTSSEYALYADDGTTKDQEASVSDDGTTFTRAEIQTGA